MREKRSLQQHRLELAARHGLPEGPGNEGHIGLEALGFAHRIVLGIGDKIEALPLHQAGKTAGPFAEVQPDARKGGIMLLEETLFRSGSDFSRDIPFVGANGRYVSITVTNNSTQPLLFQAGHLYATGRDMLATQIPAGATVTRTFEALESNAAIQPRFGVDISTGSGAGGTVDIQISAVQFNG